LRIPPHLRERFLKEAIKNGMKVLTYDIETSHMLVRTFYIGQKVSLHHHQVKVPSKVITIQYKWAHEKRAQYLEWNKVDTKYDDGRSFDDSSMIEEFATNVLSQADLVITQNGDKFDFAVLNERAKALKLSLLDQKPSIDILKLSRKSFRAASHKLDYRSHQQGLGGKIKMIDEDWVDIEEKGVPVSKKMAPYGLKDTTDTERLTWKELPYYKDLPVTVEKVILSFLTNSSLTKKEDKPFCPVCAKIKKPKFNVEVKKGKIHCLNCGEIS